MDALRLLDKVFGDAVTHEIVNFDPRAHAEPDAEVKAELWRQLKDAYAAAAKARASERD